MRDLGGYDEVVSSLGRLRKRKRKKRREKRRFRRRNCVLPYIALLLLGVLLLMLLNWESLVYHLNSDYYRETESTVTERGKDALFGVLPRTRLQYTYGDEIQEVNKITLFAEVFFDGVADSCMVYVNEKAPQNIRLILPFWGCRANWCLLTFVVVVWGMLAFSLWRRYGLWSICLWGYLGSFYTKGTLLGTLLLLGYLITEEVVKYAKKHGFQWFR